MKSLTYVDAIKKDLLEWEIFRPKLQRLLKVMNERKEALELNIGDKMIDKLIEHLEKIPKDTEQ